MVFNPLGKLSKFSEGHPKPPSEFSEQLVPHVSLMSSVLLIISTVHNVPEGLTWFEMLNVSFLVKAMWP